MAKNWSNAFKQVRASRAGKQGEAYFQANCDVIKKTLNGSAAYTGGQVRANVSAVVNIPAARAVTVLQSPLNGTGRGRYENRYAYANRVGKTLPQNTIRERIDTALEQLGANLTATNGHYAAMELNGTGVRYFGDICLVLKPSAVATSTLVLQRNSFEVNVPPVVDKLKTTNIRQVLKDWAGQWGRDGVNIAACKIMESRPSDMRLITTATASDGVLVDEDYVEVIMHKGFRREDVAEVRLTAEDAAAEALIGDQARVGLVPTASQALWRYRRRRVTALARGIGVPVRVVTHAGRSR